MRAIDSARPCMHLNSCVLDTCKLTRRVSELFIAHNGEGANCVAA